MVPSLQIEACDIFLVVEGLFLTLAKHFEDHEGDPSGHGAPSSKKLLPRWSLSSLSNFDRNFGV